VFNDITRPTPDHLMLPAVLDELPHVPTENITLFNALGTHRPNTDAELRSMLGDALVDNYRIVQNDSFDPTTQVHLGTTTRGHDVWLNRDFFECDTKILTGFIEPHFFAGFSGGGKVIMPGMAGQRTVLGNHDFGMIADPKANWGMTRGNPVWEEIREVALKANPTFILNVALNRDKEITAVFAANSGYPLDLNLYQSVKGMSAAAQVVREGGTIIVAADCWDGIPEHGLYAQLLREADNPQELLDTVCAPGFLKQDQWQAQIQAQIQLKADIYVRTDNLTDEQIEMALFQPSHRIEDTVTDLLDKYGPQAIICVLPEGPQTIPYIQP
jgi:nickel-dependent lactate racemase